MGGPGMEFWVFGPSREVPWNGKIFAKLKFLKFLLLVSILGVKSLGQLKLIFILWLCKFLFRQNLCHRTFFLNISNIFWRARVGSGYLLIDLLINRSRLLFAVIIDMQINFQIYLLRKWLQFRECTTECNQNSYNYKRPRLPLDKLNL